MKPRVAIVASTLFLSCFWLAEFCGHGLARDVWVGDTSLRLLILGVAAIATIHVIAWAGLAGIKIVSTARAFEHLPRSVPPTEVSRVGQAVGVHRLDYLSTPTPIAFCVGMLRPRIAISEGAVGVLSPTGLAAVLAHEAHHQRNLEPLRRALRLAASTVWFYLPLVGWWAARREEASELAADRHAIDTVGRPALAHALLAVDESMESLAAAAFAGSLAPRVAQLLGDPLPRPRPDPLLLGATLAGLLASLVLILCFAHLAGHLSTVG